MNVTGTVYLEGDARLSLTSTSCSPNVTALPFVLLSTTFIDRGDGIDLLLLSTAGSIAGECVTVSRSPNPQASATVPNNDELAVFIDMTQQIISLLF